MVELNCPWCEVTFETRFETDANAQTCPECLTTWSYETYEEADTALAA
jgi:Zn-finger nucleic acid-binding protein